MKYKLIKTDLLINGKLIPENSEIELSESDTKGIEDFLQVCHSDPDLSGDKADLSGEESPPATSLTNLKNEKEKTKREPNENRTTPFNNINKSSSRFQQH